MERTVLFLLLTVFHFHFDATWNEFPKPKYLQYSRDFLLQWGHFQDLRPPPDLIIPDLNSLVDQTSGKRESMGGIRRSKKRGKRAGVCQRLRKQPISRISLPSIILSNAQSLRNKMDELQAHVRFQHEFRDACLLAITETWLSERDLDTEEAIDGFGAPVRLDRDADLTGMSRSGGVCLYVNERYCKNVLVRDRVCNKDVELLSVSLHPSYLPCEFLQVFAVVVSIHPRANADKAADTIFQVTQRLQSTTPDAPVLILGDFNHCSLKKTHRDFYQYITCPTRLNKTL